MKVAVNLVAAAWLSAALAVSTFAAEGETASSGPAKTYTIKLARPCKVGDKFDLKATGKQEAKTTLKTGDQENSQALVYTAELTGQIEVNGVDGKGRISHLALTVGKLTLSRDGNSVELLRPGMVIQAKHNGLRKDFFIKDSQDELPPGIVAVLDLLIDVDAETHPDDDTLFGTDKAQAVKASWKINTDLLTKELSNFSPTLDTQSVAGSGTLRAVKKVDGVDCMVVKYQFKYAAPPKLRPELKVTKAVVIQEMTRTYPLDPAKFQTEEHGLRGFELGAESIPPAPAATGAEETKATTRATTNSAETKPTSKPAEPQKTVYSSIVTATFDREFTPK